jgi:predicted esterase
MAIGGPDPHGASPVVQMGAPVDRAAGAVILLHGRGAGPQDVLGLAQACDPGGLTYLAPQAAGGAWYPQTFLAPLPDNQPWLDSALGLVGRLIEDLAFRGIPVDRQVLAGFSQGACLGLEYAWRHPQRYAAVIGLSGGLIGPDDVPRRATGSMDGTPLFLGCSQNDPYIPAERVRLTSEAMRQVGAEVDLRLYPGADHSVNRDELQVVKGLFKLAAEGSHAPRSSED